MHSKIARFFVVSIISVFSVGALVYAANPTTPFTPSANVLDPGALTPSQQTLFGITACTPFDSNCYVTVTGSVSNTSTTTLATTTLTTIYASSTFASSTVITNATTTNFFANNSSVTNSTSTNLFASILNTITSYITNLTATNSTTSNATTTNLSVGNIVATNTFSILGSLKDAYGSIGSLGQVLSSTGTSTQWVTLSGFGGSSTTTIINSTTTSINSSTTNITSLATTTISSATTTLVASTTNIFSTGTTTLTSSILYLDASTTTITGLTNINNLITTGSTTFASSTTFAVGLTIASATPATTTNTIYNLGGVLYWNGGTLGGTSLVTNSTTTIAGAITNINSTTTNITSSATTTITSATTTLVSSTTNITSSATTTLTSNVTNVISSTTNLTSSTTNITTSGTTTILSQVMQMLASTTNLISNISNFLASTTNITSSGTTTLIAQTNNLVSSTTNITSSGTTTLTSNTLYVNASSTTITGTTSLASLVLGTLNGPLGATNGVVSSLATGSIVISAGASNVATSGAGYVLGGNLNFTIGTGNFTAPSNPEITIGGGSNSVLGAGVTITIPDANSSTRGLVTIGAQNFAGTKTFVNGFNSSATSSISGVLNMNSNLISGLATPINGTDAASKSYVDAAVVAGVATTSVISLGTTTAPGAPTSGDRYLLQAGNSGYGACSTNNIAQWNGASWFCNLAATGTSVLVTNTGYTYQFNGSAWVQTSGAISVAQLTGKQGGDGSNYYFLGQTDYNNLTSGSAQLAQLKTTGTPNFTGLNVSGTTTFNGISYNWPATQASNTVLSTNGSGVLSWITALTANLATGNIFVGNGAGQAAAVSMSGDATINSTGALTLANSGVTAGTYGSTTSSGGYAVVTVDAKGRVTGATTSTSIALNNSTVTNSTSTYFYASSSTVINSSTTNLFASNSSVTNATSTNLFTNILNALTSYIATLVTNTIQTGTITATSSMYANNFYATNTSATNSFVQTLSFVNATGSTIGVGGIVVATSSNLNGTTTFGGNLNVSNNKIIGVAAPTNTTDAANKAYVDSLIQGLSWQNPAINFISTATTSSSTGDRYIINTTSSIGMSPCDIYDICQNIGVGQWSAYSVATGTATGTAIFIQQLGTSYTWNGGAWASLGASFQHNSLLGIQGGSATEAFHLTMQQWTDLTSSGAQLAQLKATGTPTFGSITNSGTSTFIGLAQFGNASTSFLSATSGFAFATGTIGSTSMIAANVQTLWASILSILNLSATNATITNSTSSNIVAGNITATNTFTLANSVPLIVLRDTDAATSQSGFNPGIEFRNSSNAYAGGFYVNDGTVEYQSEGNNVSGFAHSFYSGSALSSIYTLSHNFIFGDDPSAVSLAALATTSRFQVINTGSSSSFLVQDQTNDTSPFIIANDGSVGVGTTTNINGGALTQGLTLNNALVLASSTALSTTTLALYNNNGTLYWNGSAVGAGGSASATGTIGSIQFTNGNGVLVATSTFKYSTTTNSLTLGSAADALTIFSSPSANTLSNSLYFGRSTGNFTTTGTNNVAIGSLSMTDLVAGSYNVGVGYGTLASNTDGIANIAIGNQTLFSNLTGNMNTAVGDNALRKNTTGLGNSAYGGSSLLENITGLYNSAFGYQAMQNGTNSQQSVAVGMNAGSVSNSSGGTYLGFSAGSSVSYGNYNTLVGYGSGQDITTGQHNLVLGSHLSGGNSITTGSNNILLGQGVRYGLTQTGSNQLNIGNLLFGSGLGNNNSAATGGIGIGTSTNIYGGALTQGLTLNNSIVLAASTTFATTTMALYNNNGTLYWNGSALGGGSVTVPLSLTNIATSGAIIVLRDTLGATSTEIRAGTSTLNNTFMGINSGSSVKTGNGNSGYGVNTLLSLMTGSNNSAFGLSALSLNTTSNNSAFGSNALASTTSGGNNSAFGANALKLNITGTQNSAFGSSALINSTSTSFNVALGNFSLSNLTTGDSNTALGQGALIDLVSGIQNTAVGRQAMSQLLASSSVALGFAAGYGQIGATSQGGTFLGTSAGENLGTGSDFNTLVGYRAGRVLTNANSSYNIILGAATTTAGTLTGGTNNILIGNGVMAGLSTSGSNQLNIGNLIFGAGITNGVSAISAGGIGIGTTTNIYGGALTGGLTLNNALVLASSTAISTTTLALYNSNGTLYWNGGAVGGGWQSSGNSTYISSNTVNVGIGTTTTANALTVNGSINQYMDANFTYSISTTTVSASSGNTALKIVGKYGYATANGSTPYNFQVIDFSNPGSPVEVSTSTFSNGLYYFDIAGKYAYLPSAANSNFTIVDISNPKNPFQVSSTSLSGARSVAVAGKYAYVTDMFSNKIVVVDVSNTYNPKIVASTTIASGATINDIKIAGRYAYIPMQSLGKLAVVDISNPLNPVVTASTSVGTQPLNLEVQGNYAYVSNLISKNISIVDITNPFAPITVATTSTLNNPSVYLKVKDNYLYSANSTSTTIFNISNPTQPTLVKSIQTAHSHGAMDISGKYLYITANGGDTIYSVVLPSITASNLLAGEVEAGGLRVMGQFVAGDTIQSVGSIFTGNDMVAGGSLTAMATNTTSYFGGGLTLATTSAATTTNTLYNSNGTLMWNGSSISGGLTSSTTALQVTSNGNVTIGTSSAQIYALGDGSTATAKLTISGKISNLVDNNSLKSWGTAIGVASLGNIVAKGDLIYHTSYTNNSLYISRLASSTPERVASVNFGVTMYNFDVQGNYAYLAVPTGVASFYKVQVLDMTNTSAMATSSTAENLVNIGQVKAYGNTLYAFYPGNIAIYDISNPFSPALYNLSFSLPFTNVNDVKIVNNEMYVLESGNHIAVYSLKNPKVPVLQNNYVYSGNSGYSLDVDNNFAYIVNSTANMNIVDIRNPYNLVSISTTTLSQTQNRVVVSGRYLINGGTSSNALNIYDIVDPTSPALLASVNIGSAVYAVNIVRNKALVLSSSGVKIFDLGTSDFSSITSATAEFGSVRVMNAMNANALEVNSALVGYGGLSLLGSLNVLATSSASVIMGQLGIGTSTNMYGGSLTGGLTINNAIVIASSTALSTTTNALYNANGSLYFNGRMVNLTSTSTLLSGGLVLLSNAYGSRITASNGSTTNYAIIAGGIGVGGTDSISREKPVQIITSSANIKNVNNISASGLVIKKGGSSFSRTDFTAPGGTFYQATGDLNGDGYADIVTAAGTVVSIMINNRAGGFASSTVSLNTSAGPTDIRLGDVNNDGKLDIVVADNTNARISVFLNNGYGGFSTRTDYTPSNPISAVDLADITGDGYLDLITGYSAVSNGVLVYPNNGNGTFAAATTYTYGSTIFNITSGDFDGDGKIDVAVQPYGGNVSILFNNGVGGLGTAVNTGFFTANSRKLYSGDMNNDGTLDIIGSSSNGTTRVAINSGNGTFSTFADVGSSVAKGWDGAGDLNGDGNYDIVEPIQSGSVVVQFNNGLGTSYTAMTLIATGTPGWAGVADFNADGKNDIVLSTGSTGFSIYYNIPDTIIQANAFNGIFSVGTSTATNTNPAVLYVTGTSTLATTDLFKVASSSGLSLFSVSATGAIGVGTTTNIYGGTLTGGMTLTNALVLASSTAISTTTLALYNNNGTLYWNGSAIGGSISNWTTNGTTSIYVSSDQIKVGIGTSTNASSTNTLTLAGSFWNGIGTSTNISLVGSTTPSGNPTFSDILVDGSLAYTSDTVFLRIFNIGSTTKPVQLGTVALGANAHKISKSGNIIYATSFNTNVLRAFDVSSSTAPSAISSFSITTGTVEARGRFVYTGAYSSSSLAVIDYASTTNPVIISTTTVVANPFGLAIAGNYAYVTGLGANTLSVVDIANPYNIRTVGSVAGGGATLNDPVYSNGYVYAGQGTNIVVIDVTTPSSPVLVKTISAGTSVSTLEVKGRYLYVGADTSISAMQIFDISNPNQMNLVAYALQTGIAIEGIEVVGKYAYTVNSVGSINVVNVGGADFAGLTAGAITTDTLLVKNRIVLDGTLYANSGDFGSNGVTSFGALSIIGSTTRSTMNGFLAIGTTTATNTTDRLRVAGDVQIGSSGTTGCLRGNAGNVISGTCSSDENLKTNIQDIGTLLDRFSNIKFVTYNWNQLAHDKLGNDITATNTGLIAQQVEKEFPELVSTSTLGFKQVDFTTLQFYAYKAIQELNSKVFGNNLDSELTIEEITASTTIPLDEKLKVLGVNAKDVNDMLAQFASSTSATSTATTTEVVTVSTTTSTIYVNASGTPCTFNLVDCNIATTTIAYNYSTSTVSTTTTTFIGKVFERLTAWFADAGNGIKTLFVGEVRAKDKICVGETCLTEGQLKQLIQNGNVNSAPKIIPDNNTVPPTETQVACNAPQILDPNTNTCVDPVVQPTPEPVVPETPEPTPTETPAPVASE